MKRLLILLSILFFSFKGNCQIPLLDRPDLLEKIKSGLNYTYSIDFVRARGVLNDLNKEIPGHPVVSFMESLIVYWENYPLTPLNPKSELFIGLLEKSITGGKSMLENDPASLEGLFFELFPRALYSEFWADNGKPGKVFPYLNSLYRQTQKGMTMQDKFPEFFFTSGLYNYYMEAYPEKHPAYKPIKLLFQAGDKQKGLDYLYYCSVNAVYVRNEARSFLSHIYMSYESNPLKASEFAGGLYREYPKNPVYTGNYAEILIFSKKFAIAEIIVDNLSKLPGDFSRMEYLLYKALLDEKYHKNYPAAYEGFNAALKISEKFGEAASSYNALAWMGLGRYYNFRKDPGTAEKYFRLAKDVSSYDYVVNDF